MVKINDKKKRDKNKKVKRNSKWYGIIMDSNSWMILGLLRVGGKMKEKLFKWRENNKSKKE